MDTFVGLVSFIQEVDDDYVMGLAIAMATSDALLDPLRIPGEVIVYDLRAELQVDAFCGGLCGNHDGRCQTEIIDQSSADVYGA